MDLEGVGHRAGLVPPAMPRVRLYSAGDRRRRGHRGRWRGRLRGRAPPLARPRHGGLLEAASDVGEGASKGNSGIATCGAETTPGTLESELIRALGRRLGGALRLARHAVRAHRHAQPGAHAEEEERLPHMLAETRANGVKAEIVSGAEARGSSR